MKHFAQLVLLLACGLALSACKSTKVKVTEGDVAPKAAAATPMGYWAVDVARLDEVFKDMPGEEEDKAFMKQMMTESAKQMFIEFQEGKMVSYSGSRSEPNPVKITSNGDNTFKMVVTKKSGDEDSAIITMSDADHAMIGAPESGRGPPMPLVRLDEKTFKERIAAAGSEEE